MKSWFQKNNIEMYSIRKEGKSVVAERFIRTLKNEIYKYMISISKNVYIFKFNDIVNKYSNTYHRTIKMKPIDVDPSICNDFNKENNKEDPNLKLVIMKVYRTIKIFLQKAIYWSEESFVKKLKKTVPWRYVISDLKGKETLGKQIEKSLELKK